MIVRSDPYGYSYGMQGLGATPSPAELISQIPFAQQLVSYAKGEVKTAALNAVKPYVIGAYVVGGFGVLLGMTALIVAVARK